MRWIELAFAIIAAALVVVSRVIPIEWHDPAQVKLILGIFIVLVAMFYLYVVDDERRPKVGAMHRIAVGGMTGLAVGFIAQGSLELYVLLLLMGVILGYVGFRWLKHVPL